MPPDLLKNAQDPHFQEAVKEYGLNYEQLVNQELQKFLSEGHHEEECDLNIGAHSPFRDYLVDKAKEGELRLTFSHNSKVHQFLGSQNFNLENVLRIPIEESQIVPIQSFYPAHVEAFLKTINEGLKISDQFLGSIRPVLLRASKTIHPSESYLEAFSQGLKTSYFLMRYSIDTARRLNNFASSGTASSSADNWLASTNETGQSVFLSPLFRESFSMLMKTAEIAASSGIPEGQAALRVLVYVQGIVDRYLQYGTLAVIPLRNFEELEKAVVSLLEKAQDNPQIIFPIIFERERNQNIELPFAIWSLGQKALAEELGQNDTALALRNANQSNITYLSNQSIELFFTSDGTRGFALSPMIMNILEKALHYQTSQGSLKFLGVINERDQARIQMIQQPARSIPDIEEIRRSIAMNMARRQRQTPALMPPAQEEPAQSSPLSAEETPYQQAPGAASSSGSIEPSFGETIPQGQNVEQQRAAPLPMSPQQQQTPQEVPLRQEQETPIEQPLYPPGVMPTDQSQVTPQLAVMPQEAEAAPVAENRQQVMTTANGQSGTYDSGSIDQAYQRLEERRDRYAQ
ncbi:MAG: hypothetical protein QF775_04150, partial [archaeon]|nr:hypothetical protein [archaeon]